MEKNKKRQCLLAVLNDHNGEPYYSGPIDGIDGPGTKDGSRRFLEDYGFQVEAASVDPDITPEIPGNAVLVFSLREDGEKLLSEHFRVREFACNDGSDVVFVHPMLPVWAEELRKINGAFEPNSAYRTVSYNATIDGSAAYSRHCWGVAMDVPARNATPEELYACAEQILGDTGGLGIYDWGIHIDARPVKSRWDSRKK